MKSVEASHILTRFDLIGRLALERALSSRKYPLGKKPWAWELVMEGEVLAEARGLGSYEIAYLCGGVEHVVMVALIALRQTGRIKISTARPRITVVERRSDDPVQRAVLDAVPDKGKGLHFVVREVDSAAIPEIIDVLRARRLLRRFHWGRQPALSRRGRRLAQKLADHIPAEHRVPVLGVEAFEEDEELHRIFSPRELRTPTRYSIDTDLSTGTPPDRSGGLSATSDGGWGGGGF